MKKYKAKKAAELLGVQGVTLRKWTHKARLIYKYTWRYNDPHSSAKTQIWTERDIEKLKNYKKKFYRIRPYKLRLNAKIRQKKRLLRDLENVKIKIKEFRKEISVINKGN